MTVQVDVLLASRVSLSRAPISLETRPAWLAYFSDDYTQEENAYE